MWRRLLPFAAISFVAGAVAGGGAVLLLLPQAPPPPPPFVEEPPPVAAAAPEVEVTAETALVRVPPEELPLLVDDGDRETLRQAVDHGRRWLRGRPDDTVFTYGPRSVGVGELRRFFDRLAAFLEAGLSPETLSPEDLAAQLAYDCEVYRSVGKGAGEMLVTGYYEPRIAASRKRTAEYRVPIWSPPGDVFSIDLSGFSERFAGVRVAGLLSRGRLLPYPDRRELREKGRLRGKEIAWARDKVDLFFLEVQGSGTLVFPDGREMRIGYAGANGRAYRSIGKLLADQGKIDRPKVSMQSIRRYLVEHPEEVDEVLDYNESVVFFRKLSGAPVGSLGVPVTAERSIATDHRLFPKGALVFLESEVPAMADDGTTVAAGPLYRLALNQDTGGAIRGADRVDFFWGRGAEAGERAGLMKQPGKLYFLVPKPAP